MRSFSVGFLAVAVAVDASEWSMKAISTVYQRGSFPYLLGGGVTNIQASEKACMDQCLALPACKFGTFVTKGAAAAESTHSFSEMARYGECWLAAQTHPVEVKCGVPCKGFAKIHREAEQPTTPVPNHAQTDECECDPAGFPGDAEAFMSCLGACAAQGLSAYARKPCNCDPENDPSLFTKCSQDPFSYHINVRHLQPRFHTVALQGGEQHRCKMTHGDTMVTNSYTKRPKRRFSAPGNKPYGGDPIPGTFTAAECQAQCDATDRSTCACVLHNRDTNKCRLLTTACQGESGYQGYKYAKSFDAYLRVDAAQQLRNAAGHGLVCKCCDCRDNGRFFEMREVGFGVHTATAPFLTVIAPIVADFHACMDLCHQNPACRAGTFLNAGVDHGKCWLSANIEVAAPCEQSCQSFVQINTATNAVHTTTTTPAPTNAGSGCPINNVGSSAAGAPYPCSPCPSGEGVLYGGCTPSGIAGVPGTPVPYPICRPCGGKTVFPCAATQSSSWRPFCQARFTAPSTGPAGNRLHVRPSGLAGGCTRGLCHICGYLGGSICNGSEQGSEGPCDAGLYPNKYGGHPCTNTGTSLPMVSGVYYHVIGTSNVADMTRPLIPIA